VTIDDLAKFAGVLGFVISLATFALTRWERRAVVHFGFESGSREVSDEGYGHSIDTIEITLINLGGKAVVLDLRTLELRRGSETLAPWQQDHWGSQESEVLLTPNERTVLGLPKDTFEQVLKIEAPEAYDKQTFYAMLPVQGRVRSTRGKVFESSRLRYWEAIGEFRRA